MDFNKIPDTLSFKEILDHGCSLSPTMYKKIQIKNQNVKTVKELLDEEHRYQKGNEPGSQWYVKKSNKYLLRTKSLQDFSYLIYPKGDCIIPINPKKYANIRLTKGDILLSKDSNIGEAAIVCSNECEDKNFCSGIVKLNIKEEYDNYYVYAFLKHNFFKEQLNSLCPKGATIKHAGERWMQCKIPFPNQKNHRDIIKLISEHVQMIMAMEKAITDNAQKIFDIISITLRSNQTNTEYVYEYPTISKMLKEKRLDAAIYCKEYEEKIRLVESFKAGYWTPGEYGFSIIPGPSLEIKLLKTRIDSDTYKKGFYQLLLPTNLSEYGTINKIQYIGTKKQLPMLKKGDILFGEAGFQKGRSTVIVEEFEKCTTNAHGLYARREDNDLRKSIYFRCIFDWYRRMNLIDLMAVGGSGGHFSPEYFEYIKIPKFDEDVINNIVSLYHAPNTTPYDIDSKDYSKWGIIQLDKAIKSLKTKLTTILDKIINDEHIEIDFPKELF